VTTDAPGDLTVTRRKTLPLGKVLLEGDLSAIPLPDVLSFIAMIRRSGNLIVRKGDRERAIQWKDGEIVFATSNSAEDSLGHFLLRNGKITSDQYEESNRRVTPTMRHGKVLVMMGALSPKDLWWGVKHQVLDIIYGLFAWKEGKFFFCEPDGDGGRERITLSINTSSVIMEGIRRIDEGALIDERIPGLDMVIRRVPGVEPDLSELDLSEPEIRVIAEIDGVRTLRQIVGLSDLTEFEAKRLVFQLLSARIVEIIQTDKSAKTVFLDVEDSPELMRVVSTYNQMFGHLFEVLAERVGQSHAHETLQSLLQSSDTDELWNGVKFDDRGRFDEHVLIANISELPFERRRSSLDEGLNTLLSIELFEISQHLDAATKVELFRFISEQKGHLEK
jgi:hypothetical protein